MRTIRFLWAVVFFASLGVVTSCTDDNAEQIVLDGITIDGQGTQIKLNQVTVSNITSVSASLESGIVSLDPDLSILDAGFVWSGSNSLPVVSDSSASVGALNEAGSFQYTLEGLEPGMLYYSRVYIETEKGTGYGNVVAFTTSEAPADVIVINEGNFQSGDGSFSTYNSVTEEVALSVFASTNGYPIGATIQNTRIFNGKIYAVTNSPDKLEVIDAQSFASVAYINQGFSSPYAFAAIGDKGYVTNWGTYNSETWSFENPFIAIVDLESNTVTSTIDRDIKPQDVVAVGDYFYVSNGGGSSVTVFNASTDEVVTDITVSEKPDRMVLDAEQDIWLICSSGNIVEIDTETNTVEKTITDVQVSGFNEKMVINEESNKLYYLSSSGWPDYETAVYELALNASSAPSEALISGTNFYGLGISPDNVVYVADANAFQGNGSVVRYSLDGTKLNSFATGRGPNGFIFR